MTSPTTSAWYCETAPLPVRTGADAFVALALGATAVGIGRPHVYGLALAGDDGVSEVLRNIRAELDVTMALTGCRTLADITDDLVRPRTRPRS